MDHQKFPSVNLKLCKISPEVLQLVPADLMKKYSFIPFDYAEERLSIAISNPQDSGTVDDIHIMTGYCRYINVESLLDCRLHYSEQFTGQSLTWIGMDADHFPPVITPHIGVLKFGRETGDDLSHRNHGPGRRAPYLYTVETIQIGSLLSRCTRQDRNQFIFLPVDAHFGAFESRLQRL